MLVVFIYRADKPDLEYQFLHYYFLLSLAIVVFLPVYMEVNYIPDQDHQFLNQ
jgi:hypothetical protein